MKISGKDIGIYINGKLVDSQLFGTVIIEDACIIDLFQINQKIQCEFEVGSETWTVVGRVSKLESDAIWLNDIKFPIKSCRFSLAMDEKN